MKNLVEKLVMETSYVGGGTSQHLTNVTDDSVLAVLIELFPSLGMTIDLLQEVNLKITLKNPVQKAE